MTEEAVTLDTVVQARSDLLATDLSDTESVMLDMDSGSYFGVEAVARTIWDALAEPRAVTDVCQIVASQYEATDADIASDTVEFVGQLVNAGLVNVQ